MLNTIHAVGLMEGQPRTFVDHKVLRCHERAKQLELMFEIPSVYYLSLLSPIVQDPRVMSWLGRGSVWDDEKLQQQLAEWYREWSKPEGKRNQLVWIVIYQSIVVGLVRLHRFCKTETVHLSGKMVTRNADFHNEWFCTTTISSNFQNMGIGSSATEVCCRALQNMPEGKNKRILAAVSDANVSANKAFAKAGFVKQKVVARLGPLTFRCNVLVLKPLSGTTTTATTQRTADGAALGEASRTPSSVAAGEDSSRP